MAVSIPTMPQPTEDALHTLANWIGHPIPESYLDFARMHDGAKPEPNSLTTSNNELGVSRFIPVREASDLAAQIDGFPAKVIPLAEDDCGNYLYVQPRTGAVYFWDHEVEGADECIAENALALTQKLMPFDASRVKLAPGQVKSVWINPSFKPKF